MEELDLSFQELEDVAAPDWNDTLSGIGIGFGVVNVIYGTSVAVAVLT